VVVARALIWLVLVIVGETVEILVCFVLYGFEILVLCSVLGVLGADGVYTGGKM
jgi:hypothetical protein